MKQQIRDEELNSKLRRRNPNEYNIDIGMSGTSCTLCIMIEDQIFYGFIGDSLMCLSKLLLGNANENTLNNDLIVTKQIHMPSNQDEKMRIFRRRGEVRGDN